MSERRVLLASFAREEDVLRAVERLRADGCRVVDVHAPYPVHGLDAAMGLAPSKLPVLCFALGSAAALFAFLFQTWVSTVDWPVRIGGKPFYAWPSFIPIAFELTILASGLGTVAALLVSRGLLPGKKPAFCPPGALDNRFAVLVDRSVAGFDEAAVAALCRACGEVEIEPCVELGAVK